MNIKSPLLFLQRLAARRAVRLLTAAMLLSLASETARAANYYWDSGMTGMSTGSGGNGTWNISSQFWYLPGTGDTAWPNSTANTADFAGTAGTVSLGSAITAGGLIFDTAGYTLSTTSTDATPVDYTLTLGASGIVANPTSAVTTISGTGAVILGAAQTWSSAGGGTLVVSAPVTNGGFLLTTAGAGSVNISGSISGTGGLMVSAGTTTLSAANAYTGTTAIGAATLNLTGGSNTLATTGSVNFSGVGTGNTGTLNLGGNSQSLASFQMNSIGTATVTNGSLSVTSTATATNFVVQPGGAAASSIATMDLTNLTSFTYNDSNGTFQVSGSTANGNNVPTSGTLKLATGAGSTNTITAASVAIGTVGGTNTSGGIGTGTLTLGTANTINAGTITVGNGGRTAGALAFAGGLTNPTLTVRGVAGGATDRANLNVGTSNTATSNSTSSITLTGGTVDLLLGTVNVSSRGASTNSSSETGSFSFDAGTVDATTISIGSIPSGGAGTSSGTITQGGGTMTVATLTLGTRSTGTVTANYALNGGMLDAQTIQSGGGTATRMITWGAGTIGNYNANSNITDLSINGTGTTSTGYIEVILNGAATTHNLLATSGHTITLGLNTLVDGAGGLTLTGPGTVVLAGANTFTGAASPNAGTLDLTNALALQSSTLTLSSTSTGAVVFDASVTGNAFTLGGLSGDGNLTLANNAGTPAAIALSVGNNNAAATYSGVLSGAGSLTKVGTATQTLSGNNTYTGGTNFNGGFLNVGSAGAINSTGTLNFGGGALQYSTANQTDYSSRFSQAAGQLYSIDTNGQAVTLATALTSTGGTLTVRDTAGGGSLTLANANTYTGGTFITSGKLVAGIATALPTTAVITFNSLSGTLGLGGNSVTLGNLAFTSMTASNTYTVNNGNLSLGANSFNFAPLATTVSTTSTLDLSGLNSFTYNQAAAGQSFNVTVGTGGTATTTAAATVNLAAGTNTITASSVGVGVGVSTTAIGGIGTLNLGTTNTINTGSILLGGFKSIGGTVQYESGLTSPTLTLRGVAGGVTPVTTITLGQTASGGTVNNTLFDTSAGSINGIVGNLFAGQVGTGSPGTGTNLGTFKMQAGTLNAGTITLASIASGTTGAVTATTNAGTFTQNAGAVLADNIVFNSQVSGNGTAFTDTSIYNLGTGTTPGILSAASISLGSAVASASSRATLNFNNGTITNYDDTANGFSGQGNANGSTTTDVQNLTLAGTTSGGAAIDAKTLNIVLASTGTHNLLAESSQSITETSTAIFTGTGGLTVNGPGTVNFQGANTYTGGTTVSSGIVNVTANAGLGAATSTIAGLTLNPTSGTATVNFTSATPAIAALASSGAGTSSVVLGNTVTPAATTLTVGGTGNLSSTFGGVISDGSATNATAKGNLTKTGTGTLTLTGLNTYVGATSITGGVLNANATNTLKTTSGITVTGTASTLSLTAADALNTLTKTTIVTGTGVAAGTVPITLAGGTLLRNGTGVSLGSQSGTTGTVGLGALTLTANSTLDFGTTGVGTLNFSGPGATSFTDTSNAFKLTVTDYTRATSDPSVAGTDGADDRLIFNQDMTNLLNDFTINGTTPTQIALGNGEYELVVPVPEPATYFGGLLVLGLVGWQKRRSLRGLGSLLWRKLA